MPICGCTAYPFCKEEGFGNHLEVYNVTILYNKVLDPP